jgi:hypothetical protein
MDGWIHFIFSLVNNITQLMPRQPLLVFMSSLNKWDIGIWFDNIGNAYARNYLVWGVFSPLFLFPPLCKFDVGRLHSLFIISIVFFVTFFWFFMPLNSQYLVMQNVHFWCFNCTNIFSTTGVISKIFPWKRKSVIIVVCLVCFNTLI